MKIIRRTISLILSGVIVALGFVSCRTPKAVVKGQQEIDKKVAELSEVNQRIADRQVQIKKIQDEIKELVERQNIQKVVYGPPPVDKVEQVIENQNNPKKVYGPPVPRNK